MRLESNGRQLVRDPLSDQLLAQPWRSSGRKPDTRCEPSHLFCLYVMVVNWNFLPLNNLLFLISILF